MLRNLRRCHGRDAAAAPRCRADLVDETRPRPPACRVHICSLTSGRQFRPPIPPCLDPPGLSGGRANSKETCVSPRYSTLPRPSPPTSHSAAARWRRPRMRRVFSGGRRLYSHRSGCGACSELTAASGQHRMCVCVCVCVVCVAGSDAAIHMPC